MIWISKIVSIGTCVVMMEFVCLYYPVDLNFSVHKVSLFVF